MQQWTPLAALVTLVMFLFSVTVAFGQVDKEKPFVGNKNSKEYHTAMCTWGKKISPKNRVEFATAEEAAKAG